MFWIGHRKMFFYYPLEDKIFNVPLLFDLCVGHTIELFAKTLDSFLNIGPYNN